MLGIKKLNDLSKYFNVREICKTADVHYSTITQKLNRYRRNHDHGELKTQEAYRLEKTFNDLSDKIKE